MASPDLSVIIVTNRGRDEELRPVPYFEAASFSDYEIIVRRDNGISKARNRGIEEATADKLVFIDDDARPCDSYLSIASQALDEHPVVAGRVVQPPDAPFTDWDIPHYNQGTTAHQTSNLAGCNMAFRREVFDTVGGFDERFEWGHDETELAERILDEYTIQYVPRLVVEHTFANSRRHFWAKQRLLGRADIQWYRKEGRSILDQLYRCIPNPIFLAKESPTRSIGHLIQKYSRLREFIRTL